MSVSPLPLSTPGACCGHNFNMHNGSMESCCLACHCGAFMPDTEGYKQCTARYSQNMTWRCKWFNTASTAHAGDHAYTDPTTNLTHHWTDLVAMHPVFPDVPAPASEKQVGGDHYRRFKIQPWDIIDEYGLDFYAGNALKYLLRRKSNRLEDLKKARHYLDKLIEMTEAGDGSE